MLRIINIEKEKTKRKVIMEFLEGGNVKLKQSISFPMEALNRYREEVNGIMENEVGEYIWHHVGMEGRLEVELHMNKDEYMKLLHCFDVIEKDQWAKETLDYLEI
jgi:hypothetical protein